MHLPRVLPRFAPVAVVMALVVAAAALAGCSSSESPPATDTTGTTSPSAASDSSAPAAPLPGGVGISPGGVTTAVDVAPSSTQSEFYHACDSALVWMKQQQGDLRGQVEPYLKMVQESPTGTRGTWDTPWEKLTAQQQSAVLLAVTTAAEGTC